MIFYTGIHKLPLARYVERAFISVNTFRTDNRQSFFDVRAWIMDSGAFTEIKNYGRFRYPVEEYARWVNKFSTCGNMQLAVSQDYMCEPFILQRTGLTVKRHQELTIERYDALVKLTDVLIMPVLQGYRPEEYLQHIEMYGERLKIGMRVGVGSVCKRNSKPQQIVNVLGVIKEKRPDLRLHGFGLKTTSLENSYILSMLYSSDSMAWSYAARREGRDSNSGVEALNFSNKIERIKGRKAYQFGLVI